MRERLLRLDIWTPKFLGTLERGTEFLSILETLDGGRWRPEKWGHFEPVRSEYSDRARDEILGAWTEQRPPGSGRFSNTVLFKRRKPDAEIWATSWREVVPQLNRAGLELDSRQFSGPDGVARIQQIVRELVDWSDAVYASAYESAQAHQRIAARTPRERLDRLNWLTFFGEPYVSLFGKERLERAAFHGIEPAGGGGILALAAPRFDSPEMTESPAALVALEGQIGADAFASRGYWDMACRAPQLDLSDTMTSPRP